MKRLRSVVGAVGVLGSVLWSATLAAQDPQSQFVPADTLPQEVLPATPFVFGAYAFAWLALLAYVYALWRRIGKVERELSDVTARLRRGQS